MVTAYEQLDKRLSALRPLTGTIRPTRGWIRAIRESIGMTTRQLGERMRVSQPRIMKLEKNEIDGTITLNSLERAAQAMGCRVAYVLIPERPLAETMRRQAERMAEQQMAAVEQTMLLEAQSVTDKELRREAKERLVQQFLQRPARLWDEL